MDLSSLNSQYSSLVGQASSQKLSSDIKSTDYSNASDDELLEACKSFEAYFVEKMYKEMMKTVKEINKDEDSSGYISTLNDYYQDQLAAQYAEKLSDRGGLGLANTLYEQMKRNYSAEVPEVKEQNN